jgi:uncharacterized membrane protein
LKEREMLVELQALTVWASTLFAGAALYVSFVEHPARMECGTELAVKEFGPSYRRAAIMQASLAILATLAGTAAWLFGGGLPWLVGAGLIFLVVPFTLMVMMPINHQLIKPRGDANSAAMQRLLQTWGRLHRVRTVLGILASLIFLGGVFP